MLKTSFDAFSHPDLERILRQKGVENLIVAGVFTHFCVDSTARTAFTHGFHVVVPRDLVAATSQMQHLHDASLETLNSLFAHVTTSKEIRKHWK